MSREFSKISPNFWGSPKTDAIPLPVTLDPRLLYFYITTNPHANSSGCYNLKHGYAVTDLKCSEKDYRKALASLVQVGLIEVEDGYTTVFVTNWVKHNEPTNARHAIGVLSQLQAADSPKLKIKRAEEFKEVSERKKFLEDKAMGEVLTKILQDFGKPQLRVSSPRPDLDQTETKTETRPEGTPQVAAVDEMPDPDLPEFVKAGWNELAQKFDNSEIRELSPARRKTINARSLDIRRFLIKHHAQNPDFREAWASLFALIERSPHLIGKSNSPWHADFDWILKPANLLKIMEGKYIEKRSNNKTGAAAVADALRDWIGKGDSGSGLGTPH